MTDVPKQYKHLIDKQTLNLMDAARWIMSIVGELGADTYEAEDGQYKVTIERIERCPK